MLDREQSRKRLNEYAMAFGRMIHRSYPQNVVKAWLGWEAELYLGDDPSLFNTVAGPGKLRFRKEYYQNSFLEDIHYLIGEDAIDTLVSFIPEAPRTERRRGTAHRYSSVARRQFVLLSILTHILDMYQDEQRSESAQVHRLPFISRGAVKNQWNENFGGGQMQTIILQSALHKGLALSRPPYAREDLIETFFLVRDDMEFVKMRLHLDRLSTIAREAEHMTLNDILFTEDLTFSRMERTEKQDMIGINRNTVIGPSCYSMLAAAIPEEHLQRAAVLFPEFSA